MAIFHLNISPISRGKGRSIAASAAYRSGEKLYDTYYGKLHDYSHRKDVLHREILLPQRAPPKFYDRQTFVNAIDDSEKRSDSRTAREIKAALPNELTLQEQIELTKEYVLSNFVSLGMGVDIAIHAGIYDNNRKTVEFEAVHARQNNPHAHIILTTHMIDENGFCKTKNRDWDIRSNATLWRESWANIQNREFERKGLEARVSHKSYAEQGVNRIPTKHIGPTVMAIEQRGVRTDRGDMYREVIARNIEMEWMREHERSRAFERTR